MDLLKKIYKDKIVTNIALLLFGLVLIIFPIESISIATMIIAGIIIIVGLSNIVYFFIDKSAKEKKDTLYFVLSLILIGVGIFTFIKPTWLVATINIFVGALLICSSINNIRYLYSYTVRNTLWWIYFSISAIILILGVVAIFNPISLASIVTRLEGISLIFVAIMSLVIMKKYSLVVTSKSEVKEITSEEE